MIDPMPSAVHRPAGAYALVVLGGGIAAVAAAREAARCGARVALLLPDDETLNPIQSDCPDTPPTRTAAISPHAELELPPSPPTSPAEFARTIRAHQTRLGLLPPPAPLDEPQIDIFRGPMWFSRYRIVSAGGSELRFRSAIVATGSHPGTVSIDGADAAAPLCPTQLDRLDGPPQRLAVIGSDGSACFWAQQLQRLGSEVHVIASEPRLLEASDERAAEMVRRQLLAEGVAVHAGCQEVALDQTGNRRGVLIRRGGQYQKLLVDEVLACSAPRPNISQLALETAAVGYGRQGIGVDDRLRTSERRIFAAGGACGPAFASPEAEEATGRLAARNALDWFPRRFSRCVIPRYTPTDPPIVEFGLQPAQAAEAGLRVERRGVEFRALPQTGSDAWREGCILVDLDHRRRLLGATVAAVGAEELAMPLMLLMDRRWPIDALERLIPCRSGNARLLVALARK